MWVTKMINKRDIVYTVVLLYTFIKLLLSLSSHFGKLFECYLKLVAS